MYWYIACTKHDHLCHERGNKIKKRLALHGTSEALEQDE